MARTPNTITSKPTESGFNETRLQEAEAATRELVTLQADQASKAVAIAKQIGYEGTLTVGVLEDEIRFYQRRTVEAILETGKRLLVLKELTPHGEFIARVELLGFHIKTAQRFMQAAVKTSKSDILSHLAKQAKNGLAFLELVTHDDDVLEGLQEMDDFDRMSASQLRQKARELEADKAANEKLIEAKDQKINKLTRQVSKFNVAVDWPEQVNAAVAVVDGYISSSEKALDVVMQVCSQAVEALPADPAEQQAYYQGLAGLAARVRDAMARQREVVAVADDHFRSTLGHFLAD